MHADRSHFSKIRYATASLAIVLAANLPLHAQGAAAGPITAFTHVAVIPMDSERVLPDYTVLVRGDRIVALGASGEVKVPAAAEQVDGTGKFLLPGLGDLHVHVCGLPCQAAEQNIVPGLLPYLANGVTTIRDMHSGGADSPLLALRRAIDSGRVVGPRIYTAGDPDITSPEAAAASIPALKAAGHDFVKLYGYRDELYDTVLAVAHRVHLPVVGHPPAYRKLAAILNDGWLSIEHLIGYLEVAMGLDGEWDEFGLYLMDLDTMADTAAWMRPSYRVPDAELRAAAATARRTQTWTCPTLAIGEGSRLMMQSDPDAEKATRVLDRVQSFYSRIVRALHDGGAGLLLCTDAVMDGGTMAAPPLPGFSIGGELRLLVGAGLTPYQALSAGTRDVAKFLGTLDSAGTIGVGKHADLVLLDRNPLEDIGAVAHPARVMVRGRLLPTTAYEDAKKWVAERRSGYPPVLLEKFYPDLRDAMAAAAAAGEDSEIPAHP